MGKQRRVHSEEFKLEAVRRLERREQPLAQIARELDLSPSLLQLWRKQLGTPSEEPVELSLEAENRRLRREVASLKEDREILKKSGKVLCEGTSMKYAFIEEQRTVHCVRRMCRLLDVSSAGNYESRTRAMSSRAILDADLQSKIADIHSLSHGRYGRPRIHAELRDEGIAIGAKRVRRLMKRAGIAGARMRRFRKTTDSDHAMPVAANILARQFDVAAIGGCNRVWDGTSRTSRQSKAGSISPSSSISLRAESSAGR